MTPFMIKVSEIVLVILAYSCFRFIDYFFVEGFVKPSISNWGKRTFNKLLPELYRITDKTILELIKEKDKDKIINFVKEKILLLEPELNDKQVESLFKQWQQNYDIIQAINNN